MEKKAQVNKLTGFALSLVVFTVVLAIGLTLLGNLRDTEIDQTSLFDSNSTLRTINGTAVEFGTENAYDSVGNDFLVTNSCSGVIIKNYTTPHTDVTSDFSVVGCTVLLTNNLINNTLVTANYTYNHYSYSTSYNATAENISAMATIPGWIPVIIVAMVGGIVLFLVIRQFSG